MPVNHEKALGQIESSIDGLKEKIRELKSELDNEGASDEMKNKVAKKIDELLMPCCRCGDMWQNN